MSENEEGNNNLPQQNAGAPVDEVGASTGSTPSQQSASEKFDPPQDDWASALAEQANAEEREKNNQKQNVSEDDWGSALQQQVQSSQKQEGKRAEFEDFKAPVESFEMRKITDLDVILDIPVTIAMEVGKTLITIRNLLKLNQGSVIELDRLAGEPLDVLVNGTLIAHGEVVVVNEKFGIRLTDVMSAAERIQKIE